MPRVVRLVLRVGRMVLTKGQMGKGYCFARDERTQVEYHDVTDGVHENHYRYEVGANFLSVGLFSHFVAS